MSYTAFYAGWGRLDHAVLPSADNCYTQAYPEYARALMENAPEGFNAAVSAWEKRHGKVPGPGVLRLHRSAIYTINDPVHSLPV